MLPRYPVYIISKGRADRCLTSKELQFLRVPHYVIVEAQEQEQYATHLGDLATILVLDKAFQRDYDTCDELGDTKGKGPGPARNMAWEHSISAGSERHWVMDDNIRHFERLNHNKRIPVSDGTILAAMEDHTERYENVVMSGPEYTMFVPRRDKVPPFIPNTRIYSCNLILNSLPYRWRGRYNEDTDLSLRILKDGWCTILYYAFLQIKVPTQTMSGGNTDEFYAREGTKPKSEMLCELHPDVSKLVWKFGRFHHQVDYRPFRKNKLIRRPDLVVSPEVNDYGMQFQRQVDGEWVSG